MTREHLFIISALTFLISTPLSWFFVFAGNAIGAVLTVTIGNIITWYIVWKTQ